MENLLYLKKLLFHFQYLPRMSMNDQIHSFDRIIVDLLNLDENIGYKNNV